MDLQAIDRTGLIREAYRIEGIDAAQCRSIFMDWALKLPAEIDSRAAVAALLQAYGDAAPDHPMTEVLRQGTIDAGRPRRRGGRQARTGRQ